MRFFAIAGAHRQPSKPSERALLAAAHPSDQQRRACDYRDQEIERLARTAGARIVATCSQFIRSIHPATYIGRGKVEEIKEAISANEVDLVIFNRDLSPVQQRNLERSLGRRIVDRTELILDIFAQHAQSKDGKIQVELAQLRYLRPRLTGKGAVLSRLGGGIGTRGPGETQLEIDRRRIDQRIARLRGEWESVRDARRLQRKSRQRGGLSTAVLVGYTNAGKSTLLNRLAKADVEARDQLFSTLDTTTRRLRLPGGAKVLISDTVGFITDLPEPLMAAFRATLEVVEEADLLIHVVDASSPFLDEQLSAVNDLLKEMGCMAKRTLTVFNKIDCIEDELELRGLEQQTGPSVRCSAIEDPDLLHVMSAMERRLNEPPPEPDPPPSDDPLDQLMSGGAV